MNREHSLKTALDECVRFEDEVRAEMLAERARAEAAEAQRDRLQREVDQLSDGFWREHRPATSDEHGIDGRIHGYCRRCIKPWPCPYSPEARDALTAQRERLAAALILAVECQTGKHNHGDKAPWRNPCRWVEIARAALADVPERARRKDEAYRAMVEALVYVNRTGELDVSQSMVDRALALARQVEEE